MSRVYFHSPSGDAELRGSERAWLAHLARGPAMAAWDLDVLGGQYERVRAIIEMTPEVPDGPYGANYLRNDLRKVIEQEERRDAFYDHEPLHRLVMSLRTALAVKGVDLDVAGVRLQSRNVDLNTALVAGSDPVRLAAKIQGWCEVHCWVEGQDREWMAGIIDEGLRTGMYRRGLWYSDSPNGPKDKWSDQGWDEVLTLLRSRDDEPVVLSYSVTDQFPNPYIAQSDAFTVEQQDAWYDLPDDEKWHVAMDALREHQPWARLAADTLTEVTFHLPVTVYDLLAPDRDERVRAAAAEDGE